MDEDDPAQDRLDFGVTHLALHREKEDMTYICLLSNERMAETNRRATPRFRRLLEEHGIEEIQSGVSDVVDAGTGVTYRDCTFFVLDAARDRYQLCRDLWERAVEETNRRPP